MNIHKSTIVGVEHFKDNEGKVVLLNDFLRDPRVIERVPALWVPKDVLDDRTRAQSISEIASSAPAYANEKAYKKDKRTFGLIFDTSSSGGVDATLEHIEYIRTHHPAPRMTFCISQTAYAETFKVIQHYANKHNANYEKKHPTNQDKEHISFLLAAPYPENDIEEVEELEGEEIHQYVGRLSLNAEKYQMGMVGSADLARYTEVGQAYVALGVCVNGAKDYVVEPKLAPGITYLKRLTTPEVTYAHATNTASHVGRTLFEDETGEFRFPYESSPVDYPKILELVLNNFMKLQVRLEALPTPNPLPSLQQRLAS